MLETHKKATTTIQTDKQTTKNPRIKTLVNTLDRWPKKMRVYVVNCLKISTHTKFYGIIPRILVSACG